MAQKGNRFTAELGNSPLEWGAYRYSHSREIVNGEGYLPIPKRYATLYCILNSNGTDGTDVLGKNIFRFSTSDGFITNGLLKAQGCSEAGDIFAKQFAGYKDLRLLGKWYAHIGAREGTKILVSWVSDTDILLTIV